MSRYVDMFRNFGISYTTEFLSHPILTYVMMLTVVTPLNTQKVEGLIGPDSLFASSRVASDMRKSASTRGNFFKLRKLFTNITTII